MYILINKLRYLRRHRCHEKQLKTLFNHHCDKAHIWYLPGPGHDILIIITYH